MASSAPWPPPEPLDDDWPPPPPVDDRADGGLSPVSNSAPRDRVQRATPRLRPGTAAYVEHFSLRLLQDALAEAHPDYWRRRAAEFLAARPDPRRDRFPVDPANAAWAKWNELTEVARACENKARFLEERGAEFFAADIAALIAEQQGVERLDTARGTYEPVASVIG